MPAAPGGRFCAACERVVVDLSALGEDGARAALARAHERRERVCVRYVYDAHGSVVFGEDAARAQIVPDHALGRKLRRAAVLAAAAAAPLLLQACGGNGGGFEYPYDAATADAPDAADAADASDAADEAPDAVDE